ncbi:MAG TPA: ABC transporter permease, partial [Bryobacteraceae bacterium]|nr:ABC transporter permease [Bryobacteraceae bacterium]
MSRQRMSRYGREFAQDLRYSVRLLSRSPAFALTAIATLALGIAVNVTIFSFINGIFLRPLNVPEPERVTALYHWSTRGSGSFSSTSYPDYEHYRDHARSFASLAAYCRIPSYTPGRDAAEKISGEVVTANYFDTMRIRPAAGRFFGPDDDRTQVVVIGSKLASRRYGSAGAAIGRTLRLGAGDFHIIGVAAEGFSGVVMDWGPAPEFWTPIANIRLIAPVFTFDPTLNRGMHWLLAAGRLRDGVSLEQARAELRVLDGQLDRLRDEKHFDAVLMPVSQAR